MIPVDQTIFGERAGNCNAACLASIFEVGIGDVPNFCADVPRGQDWQAVQNEWLRTRFGCCALTLLMDGDGHIPYVNALADGTLCILSGKSPRGDFNHAVVGKYRLQNARHWIDMLHDPHPSRDGVTVARSFDLFVLVDPAAAKEKA